MKKLFLILVVITIAFAGHAQNSKVVAAWKYLQDFYNVKDTSSLRSAKEAIDLACENADTKVKAKTWYYRGKIYQTLFEVNYQAECDKRKNVSDVNKKTLDAYLHSNMSDILEAGDAFLKALSLDKKKDYSEEITPHFNVCATHLENIAVANYDQKDYAKALIGFEKAMEINSLNGKPDTNNLMNAQASAALAQNDAKTIIYYEKMLEYKVGKAMTYNNYVLFLENRMKDDTKAMEEVRMGRKIYPNDLLLINDETNFFLKSATPEDAKKAINNLIIAVEQSPGDFHLNLALGNLYDRVANLKGPDGKELPKPSNYDELMVNAEKYYKIAYELNKTDLTTLFDLGVLFNNRAKLILDKANDMKDDAKYKAARKESDAVFRVAKFYMEDAYKLDDKDCSIILALKHMYLFTNENEKLKSMTEKAKTSGCI
jgi:hypothetical protein